MKTCMNDVIYSSLNSKENIMKSAFWKKILNEHQKIFWTVTPNVWITLYQKSQTNESLSP